MLTSKQRAVLRGMANSMDTIFQVGKGGISDTLVAQTDDALRARELIKLRVLENSGSTAREAAEQLAEQTGSEVVQVIGSRFVLYRRNPKKPVIDLKCAALPCLAAASIPSATGTCFWHRRFASSADWIGCC